MSRVPLAARAIEAGLLLGLAPLIRALPPRARVGLGHGLGRVVHAIDGGHRRLATENVRLALGLSEDAARAVALNAFRHFGRVLVEVLALPWYATSRADSLFETEGFEHLQEAHALGRGVIVFSAHYGNWELVALRQSLAGVPMDFIARPLDNPWLERAFVSWRETAGNRVLGKHGALRRALRSLREGRSLAILIDQNVHAPPRLFLPFFGRSASVTPSLGQLAVRLGAPVVPVISYPREDGGYRIVYGQRLADPGGEDEQARARELTRAATTLVESWIRARPGCWLWLHDRWKSQPHADELMETHS